MEQEALSWLEKRAAQEQMLVFRHRPLPQLVQGCMSEHM